MDDSRQEGVELPSELEFGDETGDRRENDPGSAGYTPEDDRVFRSRFQRAGRLADLAYDERSHPEQAPGRDPTQDPGRSERRFDDVEPSPRDGWMNVRTAAGDWASAPDGAGEGFERDSSLGYLKSDASIGSTPSHERPSFRDPVPELRSRPEAESP